MIRLAQRRIAYRAGCQVDRIAGTNGNWTANWGSWLAWQLHETGRPGKVEMTRPRNAPRMVRSPSQELPHPSPCFQDLAEHGMRFEPGALVTQTLALLLGTSRCFLREGEHLAGTGKHILPFHQRLECLFDSVCTW